MMTRVAQVFQDSLETEDKVHQISLPSDYNYFGIKTEDSNKKQKIERSFHKPVYTDSLDNTSLHKRHFNTVQTH